MVYMHKPTNKRLIPLIVLSMVVISLSMLPACNGAISYGNYVRVGMEGRNIFGQKLTGVYSMIVFAYDDATNKFVLNNQYTYTRNWAEKAWWCFTCFAEITDTKSYTYPNQLYNRANWRQGSWNVELTGYNEITIATTSTPKYVYIDYWIHVDGRSDWVGKIFQLIPVALEIIK